MVGLTDYYEQVAAAAAAAELPGRGRTDSGGRKCGIAGYYPR